MNVNKKNFSVSITPAVLDKIRDIVYWTPGLTVSGLVETCFINVANAMEADRGSEFPARTGQLSMGRPVDKQ